MSNYQNITKEELIIAYERLQQLNNFLVSSHKKVEKYDTEEEKLQKKDLQFRKLSANVPDLIYQFTRRADGSYFVPIASEGIKNIFGCSPEDVLNDFAPIASVIYPEDAERVINDIEYSAKHLTYFTCEFRVQLPGKDIQWILSKSTPEKLPDGSVTWYGFNANITEQKKAEEKLKNAALLLQSSIESPKDMIILSIDKNYNYLYFNECHRLAMLHAYGQEVKIGMNLLTCITSEEDRIKAKINYDKALNGESHITVEEYGELKKAYYETRYNPILNDKNEIIGTTAFSANITARKQAEELQQEREYLLSSSQRAAHVGTWNWKVGDSKVYWSDETYRIYGLSPEMGAPSFEFFFEIIHPEDRPKMQEWPTLLIAGLRPPPIEFRVMHPDGIYRVIQTDGDVIETLDGIPSRIAGTAYDITERKLAEEKLKESESRYRKVYEDGANGMVMVGKDFKFIKANHTFCQMVGYREEELQQLTFVDITHPDDSAKNISQVKKMMAGEIDVYKTEKRFLNKNGQIIWAHLTVSPINDSKGQFLYNLGMVINITEQKNAELELVDSEERLRLTTEQADIAVWEYDFNTNLMARSRNHDRLYGLEWQTKWDINTFLNATHPEDREYSNTYIQNAVAPGGPDNYKFDFRVALSDNSIRWLSVSGRVIERNKSGQGIKVRGILTDITMQKNAELALRESESRFRQAIMGAPFPIMIHTDDGQVVTINNPWTQLTGYEHTDIPTIADWTRKAYGNQMDLVLEDINNLFTLDGPKAEGEYTVTTSSGDSRIWDFSSAPIGALPDGRRLVISMAMDITERKKAEEILEESYTLIKIAGEKAKLGGWSVNIGENRVYWSAEVASIHERPTGYSPSVEEGINFYAPEWRSKIKKTFANCVAKGISFDEEMQIITESGKRVWVNTIGEAVRDDKGKIVKVHGAFQDISERKRAEESLRQSEENLAITLNSIGDGVIATDLNGLVVKMNPVAEKLCGWTLAEAVGKPLTEVFNIVNANNRETENNPVKKVMENGEIVGLANHTILIARNGLEYQISDSAAPIKNKEGKISGVVLVFSDVTEKYLTAQSLMENEERLNLFFNQSLTGFFFMMNEEPVFWNETVDKEKILDEVFGRQRVTKVNQAMLDQYLATEDKLINRTLNEFFAHDLKQGRRVIKDLFDSGSLHIETSELRFDGTQMWVEGDYICLYDSKGRIKGLFGTQHDVTNRKNAQNELQLSKMELEEYFENDISASYILTIDGYVLSCNNTFLKLFGLGKKPDPGTLNIIDFYKYPEQRKILVNRLSKERKIENYSADFISSNGLEINAILNAFGIFDENDKLIKVRGYIVDITKQIKAEAAMQLNDTALKVISQGVVITDLNRLIISSNASFRAITGYTESEIIGRTCKFLQGPLSNPLVVKAINEALKNNVEFEGNILNYRKDGTPFWNELTITPIFTSNGLLTHFIGVTRDITERKQDEEQLRKLSLAVEQSPASIILTDIKGNIEYVNIKTLKVTGYELTELIGKNPKIFSAGEKPKEEYNVLWQNITSGKEWQGEFHNKKKNGELYWEQASISPILNKEKEITHYLAVKEDITERKQILNDLIVAKEHAEESDRLKSAFLANMSHEIRTPMNGILGFAGLLKEPGLSDEKQQKYIKIIEKSGGRMLNIINDIVDISKIESGTMNINNTETDVNEKIENLYQFFRPEAEAKNIQFTVEKTLPKNEALIKTDSEKVYAVLSNLLKNAIKFTNEGKIAFGVGVTNSSKGQKQLKFFIKDTGIGIPENRQEAIFERFIQADIYDKMAIQGAGLGLSISKAYVEMLGGKIWVESEEGIGSAFYFTIPCRRETEKVIKQNTVIATKIDKKVANLKILIVEDDEASSIYLSLLVEEFSSEIFTAKNGFEAIELYKQNPDIDLILMDMKMPHLNGFEATIEIRKLNKKVIIIAQTAFSLSFDRQIVIDAGCNDYIPKPILMNDLKNLIRKYFA